MYELSGEVMDITQHTQLERLTDLDYRAQIILDAVDDELAAWLLRNDRQGVTVWQHLGMTPEEYGVFLFNPLAWARNYVKLLHGK